MELCSEIYTNPGISTRFSCLITTPEARSTEHSKTSMGCSRAEAWFLNDRSEWTLGWISGREGDGCIDSVQTLLCLIQVLMINQGLKRWPKLTSSRWRETFNRDMQRLRLRSLVVQIICTYRSSPMSLVKVESWNPRWIRKALMHEPCGDATEPRYVTSINRKNGPLS